jgi:hypothetical protein
MGQSLDSMTQKQSKDELLYQLAIAGNVDAVKALCSEGAILEVNKNHEPYTSYYLI